MRRAVFAVLPVLLVACTAPKKQELTDLRTFAYLGGDVRSGSIAYSGNPPAGGPYNAFWQTCGAYAAPVYDEYAVHSLARGAVWVAYRPGLDAASLTRLKEVLATPLSTGEGEQKRTVTARWLLAPRENLPAPIVMTVWNRQIVAQRADDERLKLFVERYGLGEQAPEAGASCAGGFTGTKAP